MTRRSVRWRVLERDSFTCRYCGRSAPDVVLEVDHVEARSAGGSSDESNLVTACFDCNQGKKARDGLSGLIANDWLKSLRRQVEELEITVEVLEELLAKGRR